MSHVHPDALDETAPFDAEELEHQPQESSTEHIHEMLDFIEVYSGYVQAIRRTSMVERLDPASDAYAGKYKAICRENDPDGHRLMTLALGFRDKDDVYSTKKRLSDFDLEQARAIIIAAQKDRYIGPNASLDGTRNPSLAAVERYNNSYSRHSTHMEAVQNADSSAESTISTLKAATASVEARIHPEDLLRIVRDIDLHDRIIIFATLAEGSIPPEWVTYVDFEGLQRAPHLTLRQKPTSLTPNQSANMYFMSTMAQSINSKTELIPLASNLCIDVGKTVKQGLEAHQGTAGDVLYYLHQNLIQIDQNGEMLDKDTMARIIKVLNTYTENADVLDHFNIHHGDIIEEIIETYLSILQRKSEEELHLETLAQTYSLSKKDLKNHPQGGPILAELKKGIEDVSPVSDEMAIRIASQLARILDSDNLPAAVEMYFKDYFFEVENIAANTISSQDAVVSPVIEWLLENSDAIRAHNTSAMAGLRRALLEVERFADTLSGLSREPEVTQITEPKNTNQLSPQEQSEWEELLALEAAGKLNAPLPQVKPTENISHLAEAMRNIRLKAEAKSKEEATKERRRQEVLEDIEFAEEANIIIHIDRPSNPQETWGQEVAQAEQDGEFKDATTKGKKKRIQRLGELADVWMAYEDDSRYELSRGRLPAKSFGGSAPYWWVRIYDTQNDRIITALTCPYTGNASYVTDSDNGLRTLEELASFTRQDLRSDAASPALQIIHHDETNYELYSSMMLKDVARRVKNPDFRY